MDVIQTTFNFTPTITFIDLFAGIGGFRKALESLDCKCVFSSEIDNDARQTYLTNYGDLPSGDITLEETKALIPKDVDIVCAGFPCQAFSIAGLRMGFEDTRGTLFFDVAEIINTHRPKAVFLENVKNLLSHDNGNTFKVIKETLEELGYKVYYKVMNAMEYGNVPQNRERIYIVAFDPTKVPNYDKFKFPEALPLTITVRDCCDKLEDIPSKYYYSDKSPVYNDLVAYMTDKTSVYQWRRVGEIRENKHKVCPTLLSSMGCGGNKVPLIIDDRGIRKFTPSECLKFQGYEDFKFPNSMSDSVKYRLIGNSVVVPLIRRIGENIIKVF